MLFDPFEKQFDLPPTAIKLGDCQRGQRKVVGKKHERLARFRIFETNTSQRFLVAFERIESGQHNGLIADQSARPVHRMRVTSLDLQIRLGAYDKETSRRMKPVQSLEIEKPSVHHIECAGLRQQLVEDIDLVHLAIADVNKTRDIAPQIEQRVQFDSGLGSPEWRPGKNRQTQIDRGRIECVNRVVQIDAKRFVDIEGASLRDQSLREVGINAPVSSFVGIGQCRAFDRRSNAQVIKLGRLRGKAHFDISEAFPISQLRKSKNAKVIGTWQCTDPVTKR